jgi:hypothetical protein
MLFDEPTQDAADQDRSYSRRFMVQDLLSQFQELFSEINFQLIPNFTSVNGDAAILAEGRVVHLYGGLAFHSGVTSHALIFALLHETGHHIGLGPRSPWDRRLACECAADSWATGFGTNLFHTNLRSSFDLNLAIRELELATNAASRGGRGRRQRPAQCWATCWNARKRSLKLRTPFPGTCSCPLAGLVVQRKR